jgi:pimeloyl-ACP methyl ester carboxylesterase
VFHSQAGQFGFKVAQARPEKVRALVAVEPSAVGDIGQAARLAGIPTLMLYGDFIDQDPRWSTIRRTGVAFADAMNATGGKVDVVDLPKIGIKGNSHMIMMDRNSSVVAGYIQTWLEAQRLYR